MTHKITLTLKYNSVEIRPIIQPYSRAIMENLKRLIQEDMPYVTIIDIKDEPIKE